MKREGQNPESPGQQEKNPATTRGTQEGEGAVLSAVEGRRGGRPGRGSPATATAWTPPRGVEQLLDPKMQTFDGFFSLGTAFLHNSIMQCPITHMTSNFKLGKKYLGN